ncbi:hypothetical protein GIB67_021382 [Kingdonia uniflora]|uniref:Uncharacterized protein n=1 Tax=Kingdonia uniflora TaxID=39325 RepID=A0A7J7MD03_9MAGN|nr:hypothetical protein GIB67_021382 [Kingdonia uniflora]
MMLGFLSLDWITLSQWFLLMSFFFFCWEALHTLCTDTHSVLIFFCGFKLREEMRESFQKPVSDPYFFSPKAPRCSSRRKEFLGLKKVQNPSVHQKPGSNFGSLEKMYH